MEIFNVSVKVYYENSMVMTFMPSSNTPDRTLQMFYRQQYGSTTVYNHYDSIMDTERLTTPTMKATIPSTRSIALSDGMSEVTIKEEMNVPEFAQKNCDSEIKPSVG